MFDLAGKIAIVTGGSRGIGRATSIALAQAGAHVLVNYRSNEEAALETVRLIEEAGGGAELVAFDVADPDSVERTIKEALTRHGQIDILVNNAGISIDQLLLRVSAKDLETTWATNVNGAVYCAKACIRPMMKKRWGRIINLSSVVGESGNAGQAVYSSSKAALLGLTRSLAREYASRGITVNAVAPGFIETDMTADLPEAARQGIVDQTPLGRIGRPEEVAAAVVFLASEEAGYITGQVVRVNGGMHV
ncbi:MAG: 3-oxoacyl-[acyl-carrier-protein] reductase [Myxococcales bacterium]|nr:3-oxoacyl-[acyl-carrier-protein] reductase [Myxococcales bacterium]